MSLIAPRLLRWMLLTVVLGGACAPAAPSPGARSESPSSGQAPRASRTLVMVVRAEIPTLAVKPFRPFGLGSRTTVRLFNAGLALKSDRGEAFPYLAEALPQLNTSNWIVSADGRMETTYRLRPNLTWHDGTALTAEDFVFSWQLYAIPELAMSGQPPFNHIETLEAPDPRTVLIKWRRPYPEAGALEGGGGDSTSPSFSPLPRHLLGDPARTAANAPDAFIAHPFWSTDYVSQGPYRLDRWESGAFLEGSAFDAHALGRPKIDRVRLLFIPDPNTAVATLLAGEAQISVDSSITFQQGLVLRREWSPRNAGSVIVYPVFWRWIMMQQRPELANPRSLLDQRVRKALAHAVDKQAINDTLFEGEGILTDSPVTPGSEAFALVERSVVRYPYDPRRTEALMTEAGYRLGSDGVYAGAAGRFSTELAVLGSAQNEQEMGILGAAWRQLGFDIKETVWPAVVAQQSERRAVHPGLSVTSGPPDFITLYEHRSEALPRPENRWNGPNRAGWSNGEFDRIAAQLVDTLETGRRAELIAQMARTITDDAGVISLYFNPQVNAFVAALTGPRPVGPDGDVTWNVHEWELR